MEDLVSITVDGQTWQVPKGTLLWETCREHGIDIPVFCYHTKLGPVGACRTCLVEQEGVTKGPITACSTPVADGMVIRTRSPGVEKAQKGIFEFLLANHPLDCPICDRGGECPLQDQAFSYGSGTSRYIEPKRKFVKPIPLGPTIALDRERCVLCWRCVRFCAEVAEDTSIVLLDRGDHTVVGTFQDEPYVSNFSGNVVELCPVGALTSRKQRFNFRPWELSNRESVCPHCAFGCNINVSVRKNDEVIRFLSRDNPEVDDGWLCDRGRFGFEFINSPERLTTPLIRRGDGFIEVSWTEALQHIADRVRTLIDPEDGDPGSIVGVASPRLTNEDLFTFKQFFSQVLGSPNADHFPRPQYHVAATQMDAVLLLERSLMPIHDLDTARTILLLGADPSEKEPVMELRIRKAINRHGARLVVISSEELTLSSKASRSLDYQPGELGEMVRRLATAIRGEAAADDELSELARNFFQEGPFAVVYDDSFPGEPNGKDSLAALAEVFASLQSRGVVGCLPLLTDCNSMGARHLQLVPTDSTGGLPTGSAVDTIGSGKARAAFLLGANLGRDSVLAQRLADLELLVVHELFMTETARMADVVLPAASFAEKIGTFTNSEGRVQMIRETVPSPGMARADWQILVELSQYFGRPLEYAMPQDVWDDIRHSVPAYTSLTYADLGPTGALSTLLQPV